LSKMAIDELKKALTAKGLEASGKKDEMVELLFAASLREEAKAARKSELKKLAPNDLKALLTSYGLEAAGKEKMVEAIMAQEAKREDELKLFDAKIDEVAEKKKEVLAKKVECRFEKPLPKEWLGNWRRQRGEGGTIGGREAP